MMFSNPKKEGDQITFNIENKSGEFNIALVNGMRRTIMADIPLYVIDPNTTTFHENSSMLNNDILNDRLKLLPLNFNDVVKYDHENLQISLDVKNNDKAIISVDLNQFVITDRSTGKTVPIEKIFSHPKILFAKLKQKQRIHLTTFISKGTTKLFGAAASPVSNVSYNFEVDQKQVKVELEKIDENYAKKIEQQLNELDSAEYTELASDDEKKELKKKIEADLIKERDQIKNNFVLCDYLRYYKKNKFGQPEVFNFKLVKAGVMESEELFLRGLESLSDTLTKLEYSITNDIVDKIQFKKSKSNLDGYDISVYYEDDTIGNLIQAYMYGRSNVKYVSYKIPHPLEPELIFKLELNKGGTENATKKEFIACMADIKKLLDKMSVEFKKLKFK